MYSGRLNTGLQNMFMSYSPKSVNLLPYMKKETMEM